MSLTISLIPFRVQGTRVNKTVLLSSLDRMEDRLNKMVGGKKVNFLF